VLNSWFKISVSATGFSHQYRSILAKSARYWPILIVLISSQVPQNLYNIADMYRNWLIFETISKHAARKQDDILGNASISQGFNRQY